MAKLSLADVKRRTIEVQVETAATGFEMAIEIQLPSMSEWNNAAFEVEFPDPKAEKFMVRKLNDKGQLEDFIDRNNPEFIRLQNIAYEELAMIRVTQALLGAGNFEDELKGLSLKEAAKYLMTECDRSILFAVNQALANVMQGTKGGVEAKKQGFQSVALPAESDENLLSEALES